MPERFWVGGSGTWNATNTTNWSDVTGGTGGQTVPTSADNVYFDANSGTAATVVEVNRPGGVPCLNLDTTGFLGTLGTLITQASNRRINISGDCTLGNTGVFVSNLLPSVYFQGAAGVTQNITCNGQNFGNFVFNGTATTTYKFLDDFFAVDNANASNFLLQGILDANNKNVTIENLILGEPAAPLGLTRTVLMGSGLWTLTGGKNPPASNPVWDARDNANLTITKSTANILLYETAGVNRFFHTGGFAYNKLTIGAVGGAYGTTSIIGGGSFTEIASVKEAPSALVFSSGQTTTVTKFSACGSYNNSDWGGTLINSIDDTQTTGIITSNTNATFPTSGTVKIGNEIISFTGHTNAGGGTTLSGVTRGANGTTATAHTAGDDVYCAYYFSVTADAAPTQATINTSTPSGVFYVGSNSINNGNNTGVTFSSGYILDYMVIANLLVSTTRSVVPTVGYSGVANQIQTTPGNALGVVGNANNGLGNDVGGSGEVDLYTGVS